MQQERILLVACVLALVRGRDEQRDMPFMQLLANVRQALAVAATSILGTFAKEDDLQRGGRRFMGRRATRVRGFYESSTTLL